jgi:3-isopropylmalate dehydrogenase
MFEPVHGSAPDIAGQQKADPTAAILSVSLLLDHLGLPDEAQRVTTAVEEDIATRGAAFRPTAHIGDAIAGRLQA